MQRGWKKRDRGSSTKLFRRRRDRFSVHHREMIENRRIPPIPPLPPLFFSIIHDRYSGGKYVSKYADAFHTHGWYIGLTKVGGWPANRSGREKIRSVFPLQKRGTQFRCKLQSYRCLDHRSKPIDRCFPRSPDNFSLFPPRAPNRSALRASERKLLNASRYSNRAPCNRWLL